MVALDWLTLGGLLLAAAFLSSIETALGGLHARHIEDAIERKLIGARRLALWVKRPDQVLVLIHLLRVGLLVAFGMTLARGSEPLGWPQLALVVGGGVAALVLGHVLPQSLVRAHALSWARLTIIPVRVLWLLFFFPIRAVQMVSVLLLRSQGAPDTWKGPFWTPGDVGQLMDDARAAAVGKENEDLLLSIIEFSDTVIKEIMVPRTETVALQVTATEQEVRDLVVDVGHSRIPVYDESIDNIVGILHVKELFAKQFVGTAPFDLRKMVRPVFHVLETTKISELLRDFQRRKTHMAIVMDDYGGTSGVVTLEDIIEEIVGEIQDEYDVEEKQFRMVGENKVLADARVNLWELSEPLGVEFPEDGSYETLAGFLVHRIGYLPQPGAVITWEALRFTVKEANEKRIGTVEIERRTGDTGSYKVQPAAATAK